VAVIRELKGLWGVMGTLRQVADVVQAPLKSIREAVSIGLPEWDPPAEVPPLPPDQETVNRVQEVIGMGTVEERKAYEKVAGQWRKLTTGQPRETPPEPGQPTMPVAGQPQEEQSSES
jgi:hypothetical protein